jgi:dolichol-phosphate mannosyltransferase
MKSWIVLPAYNEEAALPPLLRSLIDRLTEDQREFTIVVVDDGSKDNTLRVVEEFGQKYPVIALSNIRNLGLAETIKRGLIYATEKSSADDVILTMDADNTHPAGLALRMIRLIREGNDVIIASRYREGSAIRGLSFQRRFLSYGASWMFRMLFPIAGVRDYTCGYRAYRAEVMKRLVLEHGDSFITETGFTCMVDILLRLRGRDLVFNEVPLVLRYDLKPTNSKMRVWKTVWDTLTLAMRRFLGISNAPSQESRRAKSATTGTRDS